MRASAPRSLQLKRNVRGSWNPDASHCKRVQSSHRHSASHILACAVSTLIREQHHTIAALERRHIER
eukprot:768392-Pyramimonas_sp.AAC.1